VGEWVSGVGGWSCCGLFLGWVFYLEVSYFIEFGYLYLGWSLVCCGGAVNVCVVWPTWRDLSTTGLSLWSI
jgi:hypothetical protein